uniref:Aspartate/homoserine dehydrogenase NAD-binding domain-containing protein n=1 Tax=Taeniopygia guttata TaxID=59729 RepID=A0A674GY86_TAEGU
MEEQPQTRRVGILGYGELGQFLVSQLMSLGPSLGLSLAFVWTRRPEALQELPPHLRLADLRQLPSTGVALVVEVAHPCVVQEHGEDILGHADLMLGSPTALADGDTERRLRAAAARGDTPCTCPGGRSGAARTSPGWTARGTLQALTVTMTKAPGSFRAQGWLSPRLAAAVASGTRTVLYGVPCALCSPCPQQRQRHGGRGRG